jgi:urease accessory protein UreH
VMVGELTGAGGSRYALVVNLSLQRSAKVVVTTRAAGRIARVLPVDRSIQQLPTDGSLWLTAGEGALLRLYP